MQQWILGTQPGLSFHIVLFTEAVSIYVSVSQSLNEVGSKRNVKLQIQTQKELLLVISECNDLCSAYFLLLEFDFLLRFSKFQLESQFYALYSSKCCIFSSSQGSGG
ncbi:hypothetical protein P3S68_013336 [Capsicum galapagoense]